MKDTSLANNPQKICLLHFKRYKSIAKLEENKNFKELLLCIYKRLKNEVRRFQLCDRVGFIINILTFDMLWKVRVLELSDSWHLWLCFVFGMSNITATEKIMFSKPKVKNGRVKPPSVYKIEPTAGPTLKTFRQRKSSTFTIWAQFHQHIYVQLLHP